MQAETLIAHAFYLSQIKSREAEGVEAWESDDGLRLLNQIIASLGLSGAMLPYESTVALDCVVGQSDYVIARLVQVNYVILTDQTVRRPLSRLSEPEYVAANAVIGVTGLPYSYYIERQKGASLLNLYYAPDKPYPLSIRGRLAFQGVKLNTDLTTLFDDFFIGYLETKLAERVCGFYSHSVPDAVAAEVITLERSLNQLTGRDLSIRKRSLFNGNSSQSAPPSLDTGWRP